MRRQGLEEREVDPQGRVRRGLGDARQKRRVRAVSVVVHVKRRLGFGFVIPRLAGAEARLGVRQPRAGGSTPRGGEGARERAAGERPRDALVRREGGVEVQAGDRAPRVLQGVRALRPHHDHERGRGRGHRRRRAHRAHHAANRAPVLGVGVVHRGERVRSKRRGIGVSMGNAMGVVAVRAGRRGVVAAPVTLFRDAQRCPLVHGEDHRSRTPYRASRCRLRRAFRCARVRRVFRGKLRVLKTMFRMGTSLHKNRHSRTV